MNKLLLLLLFPLTAFADELINLKLRCEGVFTSYCGDEICLGGKEKSFLNIEIKDNILKSKIFSESSLDVGETVISKIIVDDNLTKFIFVLDRMNGDLRISELVIPSDNQVKPVTLISFDEAKCEKLDLKDRKF